MLIAPAVRPDFVAKLPTRGADAVFLDCEDAVPAGAKAEARVVARTMTPELVEAGCRVFVRVNALVSEWFVDDIAGALAPEVSAVVVPKLETPDDVDEVASALDRQGLGHVGIMAGIETARGVADARDVLAHGRIVAAYFGAEDFIADMGGVRTEGNDEVHYARSQVVLAGRLAGIATYDQVVTDFRNDDRFRREALEARNLGYTGKLCIHPGQVALTNEAFTPSDADVERARRLLTAYAEAQERGLAAIDFEGQMVDEPLASQARSVLARAGRDATQNSDSQEAT